MSMARLTFPSRLELKSLAGSFKEAPLKKVSFTIDLYDSPVQMPPSWDQIGVPIHFHSSTMSGSASLMRARILASASPLQSPNSAIFSSISPDAALPAAFGSPFIFLPYKRLANREVIHDAANATMSRPDRTSLAASPIRPVVTAREAR